MKIGIIGAENSHTVHISKALNVEKRVRGMTVDYVWGEKPVFARNAAEQGKIPHIVSKPSEMLGKIDALIVEHRHPKYHVPAATPFVQAGIPVFIDKPFCFTTREGRDFLALAKRKKVAVTSFSSLPTQEFFRNTVKDMKKGKFGEVNGAVFCGPCDVKSKYGGVFFYGIHQVDLALNAFGYDVKSVQVVRNGENAVAHMIYSNGFIVSMQFIKGYKGEFNMAVSSEKGLFAFPVKRDKSPFLTGIKTFCRMFRTGKAPLSHEQMLKPVQVLEGLGKSLKSGKSVRIS